MPRPSDFLVMSLVDDHVPLPLGEGILEFLGGLLDEELGGRKQRRFERLVKEAKLFMSDSLETYDMDLARAHGVDPALVRDLAGCDYIRKSRNIVLAGAVGTGKTRLARTLAFEAARRDFRVVFAHTPSSHNSTPSMQSARGAGSSRRSSAVRAAACCCPKARTSADTARRAGRAPLSHPRPNGCGT